MADPHHVEHLDRFDVTTVRAYRAALLLSTLSVGGLGLAMLYEGLPGGAWLGGARLLVLISSLLVSLNLHLYDRLIRYIIAASASTAAILSSASHLLAGWLAATVLDASLGLSFVVLSAVALKERYCFRLPIVVAIPALLALSLAPTRAILPVPASVLLLLAAVALGALSVAKLRMPLHYDIGDKRRYQV